MAILIIPAAGMSSRYGLSKPKFLLQSPNGIPMLGEAIKGFGSLKNKGISKVVVITQKTFLENISLDALAESLTNISGLPTEFIEIDGTTRSMVHTVAHYLQELDHDEPIIVKDCDNLVSVNLNLLLGAENAIGFVDLRKYPNVVAHNKSFLHIGPTGILEDVIEKEITSSYINIGCVKFGSAYTFLAALSQTVSTSEIYVSDLVRVLISNGHIFKTVEADAYEDWGTLAEWRNYCGKFGTYFVDIDGVLVRNADPLGKELNWESFEVIGDNVQTLIGLQPFGKMVFTTSRSATYRGLVALKLTELGFVDFELLMDLPHARRFLINDFAPTNPFPSAVAINLPRNSADLSDYLIK
ncbi:hypothetical protein MCETARE7_00027 [Candidatus Nanopelagicaceae bacterium]